MRTRPLIPLAVALLALTTLDARACTTRTVNIRYQAHETTFAGGSQLIRLRPRPAERWVTVSLHDDSRVPARFWLGQDIDGNGTPDYVREYCTTSSKYPLEPGGGDVMVRIAWEQGAALPGCDLVLAVGGVATFQLAR